MTIPVLLLAVSTAFTVNPDGALHRFVSKQDPSFQATRTEWRGRPAIRLISQKWQGREWTHDVVVTRPSSPENTKVWVIHVTGGPANERDAAWAQSLADSSGTPVATLFEIPNQPLDDLREDGLIAHTFQKYLETGDESWPLLFPMVKSVVGCMDALDKEFGPGLQFVLTGASKRGWTTWLAAATGDKRIVGIAPMVFDNLSFGEQLAKQQTDWGKFSPMIQDYTSRGLQDTLASPRGKELVAMVDPAAYLAGIRVPVLMVNGANDPYWTVDALSVYWNDIRTVRKWVLAVPNAGHDLGPADYWQPTLATFVRSIDRRARVPVFEWHATKLENGGTEAKLGYESRPKSVKKWVATSDNLDFSGAKWESSEVAGRAVRQSSFVMTEPAASQNKAVILELTYETEGVAYRLSTPPFVVRKKG
ncbi:MAG: hypothetical protein KF884_12415 [Fimbriimonadaceae bacterium]|nr:hypothetical protein [Fimbriimonadaceae bacterium]QYK58346.1 MAG: hypothetical protein KF884_12415 [Fimbriimonadaceae bacterium]